jgi:hypothetical protein
MPATAAIVDQFRPWLGRLIYASENGHVIDRREPVNPDAVWVIPRDYRPYTPKEKK